MDTFLLPARLLPAAPIHQHVKAQGLAEGLGKKALTLVSRTLVLLSAGGSAFPRLIQRGFLSLEPAS